MVNLTPTGWINSIEASIQQKLMPLQEKIKTQTPTNNELYRYNEQDYTLTVNSEWEYKLTYFWRAIAGAPLEVQVQTAKVAGMGFAGYAASISNEASMYRNMVSYEILKNSKPNEAKWFRNLVVFATSQTFEGQSVKPPVGDEITSLKQLEDQQIAKGYKIL